MPKSFADRLEDQLEGLRTLIEEQVYEIKKEDQTEMGTALQAWATELDEEEIIAYLDKHQIPWADIFSIRAGLMLAGRLLTDHDVDPV